MASQLPLEATAAEVLLSGNAEQDTIRITDIQVIGLRALFLFKKAHRFGLAEKKVLVLECMTITEFSTLKQTQIHRCLVMYCAEQYLRQHHGVSLIAASKRMISNDDGFAYQSVIFCLSFMKQMAETNEFNGLPSEFYKFIDRILRYSTLKAAGQSQSNVLSKKDLPRMETLVKFVKEALLPQYVAFWETFSAIEKKENVSVMKGRPDLYLAKLEEVFSLQRRSIWCNDSRMFLLWSHGTCMKYFVTTVHHTELYTLPTGRNECFPPPYAEAAMLNETNSLEILLFATFETAF